ncbi:MAG: sulfatase-like hydrolase/transferase [Pseudomonadota bacterium]
MKKLIIVAAGLMLIGGVLWHNRINLLVTLLPIVQDWRDPIAPNQPIEWAQGPETAAVAPGERPPNIILFLTDDMGFNDVSLYNGGAADGSLKTPHIDALANDGVRFDNGYAANAVCAPSRATILTGRYSTRFGFEFTPFFKTGATIAQWMLDTQQPVLRPYIDHEQVDALPGMQDLGMPTTEITIAELLKSNGYRTAHIGKWHLGANNGMHPLDQGFDESLYMSGMLYLPEDHPDAVNAKRLDQAVEKMVWANARYSARWNRTETFEPDGYLTDYYTQESLKFIEANRNQPFFLYLAHWGIHNPLQATRADYEQFAHIKDHHLRVYAAMIHAIDRSVAALDAKLEQLGLAENTLILFTSDNGGAGYIGLPDVNKPYRGWKLTHFEGGTHVPFMAKWPARIRPGSVYDAPVHHIDLYHTIAAAAGVPVPADRKLDGVDLMPYVTGETDGVPHDTLFWKEGHHQSVQHRGWKLIRADLPETARWLYHLAEDATEQQNLAASEPEKLAELEALLAAHAAEQAEPLWPSVLNTPQLIDKHGGESYAEGDEYIYWPN